MVAVAGFVVLSGQTGVPFYISALAVLGVNRFFLSALSRRHPARRAGTTSWSWPTRSPPPAGRSSAASAASSASASTWSPAAAWRGSAATLWFAGACYVVAGLLGTRLAKDLLGPSETPDAGQAGSGTAGSPASSGTSSPASSAG